VRGYRSIRHPLSPSPSLSLDLSPPGRGDRSHDLERVAPAPPPWPSPQGGGKPAPHWSCDPGSACAVRDDADECHRASAFGPAAGAASRQGCSRVALRAARLDGWWCGWKSQTASSRTVLFRRTWNKPGSASRDHKGARPAVGPCLLPHCDASRAHPSTGADLHNDIAELAAEVKNKVRTYTRSPSPRSGRGWPSRQRGAGEGPSDVEHRPSPGSLRSPPSPALTSDVSGVSTRNVQIGNTRSGWGRDKGLAAAGRPGRVRHSGPTRPRSRGRTAPASIRCRKERACFPKAKGPETSRGLLLFSVPTQCRIWDRKSLVRSC